MQAMPLAGHWLSKLKFLNLQIKRSGCRCGLSSQSAGEQCVSIYKPCILKMCVALEALRTETQSEVFSPSVSNRNLISPSLSHTWEIVVYINLQRLNPFFPKSLWLAWDSLPTEFYYWQGAAHIQHTLFLQHE